MKTVCRAFTLVEVMVVVVLIGLMAGAVAVSLTGDLDRATREDVIGKLTYADAQARMAGKRLGPSTLTIDLDEQRLWLSTPTKGRDEPQPGNAIGLARDYTIQEVVWLDPKPITAKNARDRQRVSKEDGTVELPYSAEGYSRTYALRIEGPASGQTQDSTNPDERRTTWLLFAGLTGHVITNDDPQRINNLLATLAHTRADAD